MVLRLVDRFHFHAESRGRMTNIFSTSRLQEPSSLTLLLGQMMLCSIHSLFSYPTQVVLRNNFSFKFLVVTKNTRKLFRGVRILNCLSVKIFGLVIIHSGKGCQLRDNLLSSFSIDSNYIFERT